MNGYPNGTFFFNRDGRCIVRLDMTMEEGRAWARRYNRAPGPLGKVDTIANAPKASEATAVSGIY